ncbi:MAG TPA: class I SAM-dependent methyltransferase [Clostridia bacterium]|nr:class I SAM-dependent methyltransferase [Clostridia bacterium]
MGIYENESWMELPDSLMRPGGFKLTQRLLDVSGLAIKSWILDLGCGLGGTVDYLNTLGFRAVGVDCSEKLIQHGRIKYPNADLLVARGENLPFGDKTLDAVLAECSLSTTKLQIVLNECARILKKSGKLLISDVYARQQTDKNALHVIEVGNFIRRTKWEELLDLCGFKLLLWEDHTAVWKKFLAQFIWESGSLAGLIDCAKAEQVINARPGYFLALAMKQ